MARNQRCVPFFYHKKKRVRGIKPIVNRYQTFRRVITMRENVQAQLRVYVKRILRNYGYPPDKQEKATWTVLEQAEVLSEAWAVG
jgi:hypothetical protein